MPYFSGSFCEPLEISGIYGNSWDFFKVSGNFLDLRPTVSLEFCPWFLQAVWHVKCICSKISGLCVLLQFDQSNFVSLHFCTFGATYFDWMNSKKTWSVCILNIHPGVDNKYDWRAVGTASQRGRGGCINISKLKTEKYRNIWTSGWRNIWIFENSEIVRHLRQGRLLWHIVACRGRHLRATLSAPQSIWKVIFWEKVLFWHCQLWLYLLSFEQEISNNLALSVKKWKFWKQR